MNLKGFFSNSSLFSQLVLTAFFALFGLLFFSTLGILGIAIFKQLPISEVSTIILEDTHLKILQIGQTIGLFLFPTWIMIFLTSKKKISQYLQVNKYPQFFLLLLSIIGLLSLSPFVSWINELNANIQFPDSLKQIENWMLEKENIAKETSIKILSTNSYFHLLINILVIAIIPAICEELFFRGLIQKIIYSYNKNTHLSVWLTAFAFSFIHLQFYGFFPRMLLGAFLGYLVAWTKNMWYPIIAHFLNNALIVILYFLYFQGYIKQNPTETSSGYTLIDISFSLLIFIFIFYLLRKRTILSKQL